MSRNSWLGYWVIYVSHRSHATGRSMVGRGDRGDLVRSHANHQCASRGQPKEVNFLGTFAVLHRVLVVARGRYLPESSCIMPKIPILAPPFREIRRSSGWPLTFPDYKTLPPSAMTKLFSTTCELPLHHVAGLFDDHWPRLHPRLCECGLCTASWSYSPGQRCHRPRIGRPNLQRELWRLQASAGVSKAWFLMPGL